MYAPRASASTSSGRAYSRSMRSRTRRSRASSRSRSAVRAPLTARIAPGRPGGPGPHSSGRPVRDQALVLDQIGRLLEAKVVCRDDRFGRMQRGGRQVLALRLHLFWESAQRVCEPLIVLGGERPGGLLVVLVQPRGEVVRDAPLTLP